MTVIASAARTPFGKFGGVFKSLSAVELGAAAIREAVRRSALPDDIFDLAIIGQVLQAGCGQIPSRQATIKAGLPVSLPSETLNKVCASSFRAVTSADQMIRSGDVQAVIAGGMESMSNTPYASPGLRWGARMFNAPMIDLMVHDGLWCAIYDRHMAVHGGTLAKEYGISRQAQDEWALRSQNAALAAMNSGRVKDEVAQVTDSDKKGEVTVDRDEGPRSGLSMEILGKMAPIFDPGNTVTAGNAPSTNDGGTAIVLLSEQVAAERQIKPLATIMGSAMVTEDAVRIASAPGQAINKLLKRFAMKIDEIGLIEINEAFAAVPLVSGKIIGCDMNKVNVNGGAVAYGHPIGASGARVIMNLAYEMRRRRIIYGIAAICSGGAQGDALLLRCDY
jgi:acetyl-CoA C-acetyltransferase